MEVWSGGNTTRYIRRRPNAPITLASAGVHTKDRRRGVRLRFVLPVPGGKSTVHLWVAPFDFTRLAAPMMQASPEAAERAFLEVLLKKAKKI